MLPYPLHPAVVHFPVVLAFLLPLVAGGTLWAIRTGARPARAWLIPLAFAAALSLSAWVAVETGEAQEERVENVVPNRALDAHEDAAEAFLTMSAILVVITAAGLARGLPGRAARGFATAGAVALLVAGARVGHSGGELVYRYGAASAYTPAANGPGPHVTAADTAIADTMGADSTAPSRVPRLASSHASSRPR